MEHDALRKEYDAQVATLVERGYPALAGLTEDAFADRLADLRTRLPKQPAAEQAGLPFVIVVSGALVPQTEMVARLRLRSKPGFTDMPANDLDRFGPIEGLEVPAVPVYLLVDVDPGAAYRNVTPDAALPQILAAGRSPLTLDEGLAVVTHHPELLRTATCFSLLGSRCGDKRVTAAWVSAGRPRIGWCWAGNPHTWLGSASAAGRIP